MCRNDVFGARPPLLDVRHETRDVSQVLPAPSWQKLAKFPMFRRKITGWGGRVFSVIFVGWWHFGRARSLSGPHSIRIAAAQGRRMDVHGMSFRSQCARFTGRGPLGDRPLLNGALIWPKMRQNPNVPPKNHGMLGGRVFSVIFVGWWHFGRARSLSGPHSTRIAGAQGRRMDVHGMSFRLQCGCFTDRGPLGDRPLPNGALIWQEMSQNPNVQPKNHRMLGGRILGWLLGGLVAFR